MAGSNSQLQERLWQLKDESYREFQCKLMPTVDPQKVIGVRTPQLRQLAKEVAGSPLAAEFISKLPHEYYEENNLHGCLICALRGFDECVAATDAFLPYVDNWATCDMLSPAVFKKHLPQLLEHIDVWLADERAYTVRFGIGMLMSHYLDEDFKPEYLARVAAVKSEEYYVRMMVAWYFATALAKQWPATLPYIEQRRLDSWTHAKTIRKAIESFRVSDEHKTYLRTLA